MPPPRGTAPSQCLRARPHWRAGQTCSPRTGRRSRSIPSPARARRPGCALRTRTPPPAPSRARRLPKAPGLRAGGLLRPRRPGPVWDKVSQGTAAGNSARRANLKRSTAQNSAWKSGRPSWTRPGTSWQSRNRPNPKGRCGRSPGPPGGRLTALSTARFMRMSMRMWASRGPTAPSWWQRPGAGNCTALPDAKSGSTRPRPSGGRSPSSPRPRQITISTGPPRNIPSWL